MRRRWQRRCCGLAVAAAVLAAGCSGNANNDDQATRSAGQAATATTLTNLPQPSSRCGAANVKATVLRFPAADGTQLDGVLLGSGPAGVVLLHQHPADLCGFWPYAVYLSKRGLHTLAIDLRCYGKSACPQADDAKSRVVDDVAGAVAALRAHGAKRIALVGASLGASTALLAGAALRPPVAAVVSLSTGKFDLSTILGGSRPLDTYAAAKRLTAPSCSRWRETTGTSRSSWSRRCIGRPRRGTSSLRSLAGPPPACTAGTSSAVPPALASPPSPPRSPASSAPTPAAKPRCSLPNSRPTRCVNSASPG
jgi:pimeloyl-ACP methyl ester carboxylesterase